MGRIYGRVMRRKRMRVEKALNYCKALKQHFPLFVDFTKTKRLKVRRKEQVGWLKGGKNYKFPVTCLNSSPFNSCKISHQHLKSSKQNRTFPVDKVL